MALYGSLLKQGPSLGTVKFAVDSSACDHAELRPRAGAPLPASPQLVTVSNDGTDQFVSTSK